MPAPTGWKDTTQAPQAAAWPWWAELHDLNWVPDPAPPDEAAACRYVHRQIKARDKRGLEDRHVLDLGCGRGACLGEALLLGAAQASAVDLSADAVALTAKLVRRFGRTLRYAVVADGSSTKLPSRIADIVWSHGVVEHLRPAELAAYMKEAARLSNGYVAVSAPNPGNGAYQEFRQLLLSEKRWPYGYEEPLQSYAAAIREAGLYLVADESVGDATEDLATLYARNLPWGRRNHWREKWSQGKLAGPVTVAIGCVRP